MQPHIEPAHQGVYRSGCRQSYKWPKHLGQRLQAQARVCSLLLHPELLQKEKVLHRLAQHHRLMELLRQY